MRGFDAPDIWPPTGHPERVELGPPSMEGCRRAAPARTGPDFADALPGTPSGRAMFQCIFGASPFLGACAVRDPGFLRTLWEHGPGSLRGRHPRFDSLPATRSRPRGGRQRVADRAAAHGTHRGPCRHRIAVDSGDVHRCAHTARRGGLLSGLSRTDRQACQARSHCRRPIPATPNGARDYSPWVLASSVDANSTTRPTSTSSCFTIQTRFRHRNATRHLPT